MARGFVEFWLIWIAVDVVGVPLLVQAKFYPSATMYVVYGLFCVIGFVVLVADPEPRGAAADRPNQWWWADDG